MDIKNLMNTVVTELKPNEIIEAKAITNMLAGCGIKSGKGSCGKNIVAA